MENDLYGHYGLERYWPAGYIVPFATGGATASPLGTGMSGSDRDRLAAKRRQGDPTLRSVNEVDGYYIGATDGDIGHVEEFLVDEEAWAIRYVVVDTRNWWPGKKVLVSPQWILGVSWGDKQIRVDLTRERIKNSPSYEPESHVDRSYERRLFRHYDYPPYWVD